MTNFSDLTGSSFLFRDMSETGDSVPPSRLEDPRLLPAPNDTIKFKPSAFVAIMNTGSSTPQTQTLSTQLSLTLQSLSPSLALEELTISVAGTRDLFTSPFAPPGITPVASADLALQFDLIFGGVTKNFIVPITQSSSSTWAGIFTVTQQTFAENFVVPAGGITDLIIRTTQTVSATAAYGNASSGIDFLDITAKAVPEPNSATLFLVGAAFLNLMRRQRNLQR